MKHYTHFLKKRAPHFIQLGKMSNAISYDIEETKVKSPQTAKGRNRK